MPPPVLQQHQLDLPLRVVQTLVLYALCEHQLGHATRIAVAAHGCAFSVSDNGRGHSASRQVEGAPYLDFIYEHLSFPFGRATSPPVQLQGLGMSLLNQLCSHLEVTIRKPVSTLRLRFEGGALVAHELLDEANPESGNTLCGGVIPGLSPRPIDARSLSEWLSAVQGIHPSLELSFNGRQLQGVASGAQAPC